MYWRLWTGFCIGKCIAGLAGWLAAFAFFFLVLSFHLISSHFISFHLISFDPLIISCHVPSGYEMDQ